jgi:hypothetical protein
MPNAARLELGSAIWLRMHSAYCLDVRDGGRPCWLDLESDETPYAKKLSRTSRRGEEVTTPNRYVTDRGFTWYDDFVGGNFPSTARVSVYQSSEVGEHPVPGMSYLWLLVDRSKGEGTGAFVSLRPEDAERVRDAIDAWLADREASPPST